MREGEKMKKSLLKGLRSKPLFISKRHTNAEGSGSTYFKDALNNPQYRYRHGLPRLKTRDEIIDEMVKKEIEKIGVKS